MTLFYKCLYSDEREALYQRHCRIIRYGSDRDVLELSKILGDRIEGRPGPVGQERSAHSTTFVLMTRDGQEVELLPPTPPSPSGNAPAAAAAVSAEDALILQYTAPVRPV
jgi:hypothetical protein